MILLQQESVEAFMADILDDVQYNSIFVFWLISDQYQIQIRTALVAGMSNVFVSIVESMVTHYGTVRLA